MKITLIILILVAIFGFLLYNKYIKNQHSETSDESKEEDIPDFEHDFFNRTQNGEKSQLFLSLAAQQDCAMIRSLLQAENIPTYTEGEHMNNIYGGITGSMTSVVAIKVYILCSDYDKAFEIVKSYKTDSSGITIFPKESI